jgi:hypothetical protein
MNWSFWALITETYMISWTRALITQLFGALMTRLSGALITLLTLLDTSLSHANLFDTL